MNYELHSKALEILNQDGFYPTRLELDGRIHRFKTTPTDAKANGWYIGYDKGTKIYVIYNDWRLGGRARKICVADDIQTYGDRDFKRDALRELASLETKAERQQALRQESARLTAKKQWLKSAPWRFGQRLHPYYERKGLSPNIDFGITFLEDTIVIPMRSVDRTLHGIQQIDPNGEKRFTAGSKKRGSFFTIGDVPLESENAFLICEGFATGASLFEATSFTTIVCFDAGNLLPVSASLRQVFPETTFIFCADEDPNEVGREKAIAAARAVGKSKIIFPDFLDQTGSDTLTDFNDLACSKGVAEIRRQLEFFCVELLPDDAGEET